MREGLAVIPAVILLQKESLKLALRYIGPFEIEMVINPSVVHLKLPLALRVHPTLQVSLLKLVASTLLNPPADPTHTFWWILDLHRWGQGFQCLVDWEGYGPEEQSWISRSLILDPSLVDDFYRPFPFWG